MKNTDSTLSDSTLIEMFKAGDNEAFGKIAERYTRVIDASLLKFCKDPAKRKDIRQDALIKAMDAINRDMYVDGNCKAWLLRIARNLAIDEIRKSKNMPSMYSISPTDTFKEDEYQEYLPIDAYTKSPEEIIIKTETEQYNKKYAEYLIGLLPKPQQEVVILRFFLNRSCKEIAQLTNVSINTAVGRIRYARINLREHIRFLGLTT